MKCPGQTRGAGCIIRSALIIGTDLPHNDEWTTALLTNPEVIAVDQHSTANRPLLTTNSAVIWSARPADWRGHYLAIFNRAEVAEDIALEWNDLGLTAGKGSRLRSSSNCNRTPACCIERVKHHRTITLMTLNPGGRALLSLCQRWYKSRFLPLQFCIGRSNR
jgi:hypothetical protein